MSKSGQLRLSKTKTIPNPNEYILALHGEYREWSFDEEAAPLLRGLWREKAFTQSNLTDHASASVRPQDTPLDLEIGTGNGLHFAHHAAKHPERFLLGLELKYKPLIQSIRRARRADCVNARIARYNAYLVHELFNAGELNDVFIFFPDPWERTRQHKHRLIQDEFLARLFERQRPGSSLYFKTDNRNYFDWALERFQRSPYSVSDHTYDLHASEFAESNFITQFERIFMRQNIPIGYAHLVVP